MVSNYTQSAMQKSLTKLLSFPFIDVNKNVEGKIALIEAAAADDASVISELNYQMNDVRFLIEHKANLSALGGTGLLAADVVVRLCSLLFVCSCVC